MDFREMTAQDWPRVREIYLDGIETGIATFQTSAPDYEQWDAAHLADCRILAVEGDEVLGWAALSPTSSRQVYCGVVELSLYVAAEARGRGVGSALLAQLVRQSEQCGYWMLVSAVFEENVASRRMHEKCGFREVGYRERIAVGADGRWHNTVLIERRSKTVGAE